MGGVLLYCSTKLSLTSVIPQYASLAFSSTCSGCRCDTEINTGGLKDAREVGQNLSASLEKVGNLSESVLLHLD